MKGSILLITIAMALTLIGLVKAPIKSDNESEVKETVVTDLPETKEKTLEVQNICQYPDLPTGCESVAAVMVLQYYGEDVSSEQFADSWLKCSTDFYISDKVQYGPDPNEVFAGDPFSENAYGCFAPPIAEAVNQNSQYCTAEVLDGYSLDALCNDYIDRDCPILVWATSGMKESKRGRTWHFENGEKFTWISGEHCLVLVGYNEDFYYFNDPQSGSTVAHQKSIAEERFEELGSQAVYIYPKEHFQQKSG